MLVPFDEERAFSISPESKNQYLDPVSQRILDLAAQLADLTVMLLETLHDLKAVLSRPEKGPWAAAGRDEASISEKTDVGIYCGEVKVAPVHDPRLAGAISAGFEDLSYDHIAAPLPLHFLTKSAEIQRLYLDSLFNFLAATFVSIFNTYKTYGSKVGAMQVKEEDGSERKIAMNYSKPVRSK